MRSIGQIIQRQWKRCCTVELLVAVYLLSGAIDLSLKIFGCSLPLPTVVFAGLLMMVVLVSQHFAFTGIIPRIISENSSLRAHRWLLLSLMLCVLWFAWRAVPFELNDWPAQKFLGFLTGVYLMLCLLLLRGLNWTRLVKWMLIIGFSASVINLIGTEFYLHFEHYMAVKDAYLYLSHALGFALLAFWFSWPVRQQTSQRSAALVMVIAWLTLLLLNARFTYLFVGLAVLLDWVIHRLPLKLPSILSPRLVLETRRDRWLIPAAAGIGIALLGWMYVVGSNLMHRLITRGQQLTGGASVGNYGKSIEQRLEFWKLGLTEIFSDWSTFFIGNGWGSFALMEGHAGALYPHNLLIELWLETGLIGVLLLLMLGYISLRSIKAVHWMVIPFVLIAFELLSLMKSHSMADTRWLFFLLAMYSMVKHAPQKLKVVEQS